MLEIRLAEDFVRLVGPKGRHNPARAAVRHGSEPGQVTLGDRRVSVSRPRVRTADGTGKVTVPTYQAFALTDLMDQLALERMLAKLSSAATRPVVGTRPGSGGRPVQGVVIPGGEQQRAPMLEQPSISTLSTTAPPRPPGGMWPTTWPGHRATRVIRPPLSADGCRTARTRAWRQRESV